MLSGAALGGGHAGPSGELRPSCDSVQALASLRLRRIRPRALERRLLGKAPCEIPDVCGDRVICQPAVGVRNAFLREARASVALRRWATVSIPAQRRFSALAVGRTRSGCPASSGPRPCGCCHDNPAMLQFCIA
ncbi:MAG: hypothetical protein QOI79_74 [Mycobacterium sp.]|jgi:hypothetical protein|nr:hypothetical protein [Mycobacterium sp.]